MEYQIAIGKDQQGPFSEEVIHEKAKAGELSPSDLAWNDSMDDWKPLSEVFPEMEFRVKNQLPPLPSGRDMSNRKVHIGVGVGVVVLLAASLLIFMGKWKGNQSKNADDNKTSAKGNGHSSNGGKKQPSKPKKTVLKIKGLHLGMDIHSAVAKLKEQVPVLDFVVFDPSKQPKTKNDAQSTVDALRALNNAFNGGVETEQSDIPPISLYAKSKRGLVTIGADSDKKVVYFLLDGDVVNEIFDAKQMGEQRFLQTFIDAYKISGLSPHRQEVKDGLGNKYGYQTVYKHINDKGFEIRFYSKFTGDENKLRNNTLSARLLGMEIDVSFQPERTMELIKKKSSSEASKSFD